MNAITVTMGEGEIATVTFDDPARPVNTMTPDLLAEMEDKVAPLLEDPRVNGMIFRSAKPDTFIAGADIKLFAQADDPELVSQIDGAYSRLLTRLFENPKPVVAAVHGAALGGGLEIALACHYILASDHPATVLGLPEVTLGILPAAGGTQRLPLRVGLIRGLDMMLTGRRVRARRALKMGLVDAVVPPGEMPARAQSVAAELSQGRRQRPGPKQGVKDRLITLPMVRGMVLARVRKQVVQRTRGNYPAPMRIIECVERGLQQGPEAALAHEIVSIGELMMTPQSRSLVRLFLATQELKAEAPAAAPVVRLAVIGAGEIGGGIASISLGRCPVLVQDASQEALKQCAAQVKKGLARQVRAEAVTPAEETQRWSELTFTRDMGAIAGADLVVEATSEALSVKRRVLAEVEERVRPEAVVAVQTFAPCVSEIARGARHPERVVGMHYVAPVHKVPLVELAAPEQAAPWALDKAHAFAQAQGKTVIRVKDRPGLYTTRILTPYLLEALLLLEQGISILEMDGAMQDFGYGVGPMALMDALGMDRVAHGAGALGDAFSERWGPACEIPKRIADAGFLGRRNGRGFYTDPGKGKRPNPEIQSLFPGRHAGTMAPESVQERLSFVMLNEAALCLQEEVIASPRDGDVGAVLGLGFPPFRGGPFHHVDALGAETVATRMERIAEQQGARYAPAPMIVDMARKGKKFFQ